MPKKKAKKGTVHTKKLKKDTKDGPIKLGNGVNKQYQVTISYSYLLKAPNNQEAIQMSMDRLLSRRFGDVYFDGMVTTAQLTDRVAPKFDHIKHEGTKSLNDFEEFQEFGKEEKYGVRVSGSGESSKEQDYIHLSSADQI